MILGFIQLLLKNNYFKYHKEIINIYIFKIMNFNINYLYLII